MNVPRGAVVVVALIVVVSMTAGIAAAETRMGGTITVGADETVDDLTVVGGTVVIDGTVQGDLTVLSGSVEVNGDVEGSINGLGGSIEVSGSVDEGVRMLAGSITVREGATIGSLSAAAGSVQIAGTVAGDVRAGAGTTTLADTAVIDGDLRYGGSLSMADGAVVHGDVSEEQFQVWGIVVDQGVLDWIGTIMFFMMHLLLGALLLLAAPRFSQQLADAVHETPVRSGLIGFALLVFTPLVLVAVALTIIGIPLAMMGLFALLVLVWIGLVYGRYAIGEWLLSYTDVENRWIALILGLVVIGLVAQVPVIGWWISFVVTLLGLGALAHLVWTRRSGTTETATPA